MRNKFLQKALMVIVLLVGLMLLAWGSQVTRKIYDADSDDDIATYHRVSEKQLVEDATFSGVERRQGKLISTYDRSAAGHGKRSCPT